MAVQSLKNQLNGINVGDFKLSNGKTLSRAMIDEGERLKWLLHYHLLTDALLIEPKYYAFGTKHRTYHLEQSIHVDVIPQYNERSGCVEISVTFRDDETGASGYGAWDNKIGDLEYYNLALLLDTGYTVQEDVWFKHIENFGYRKPSNFIANALDDFNKENQLGIFIDRDKDVFLKH